MEASDRMKDTKWGKQVVSILYYAFLVFTVGAFLLFIPLHSGLTKKSGEPSHPSSEEMITHRDTNATGERELVDASGETTFVFWLKEFQSQNQKGEY